MAGNTGLVVSGGGGEGMIRIQSAPLRRIDYLRPDVAAEANETRQLGCWLCTNARATADRIHCAAAETWDKQGLATFPRGNDSCRRFNRRKGI